MKHVKQMIKWILRRMLAVGVKKKNHKINKYDNYKNEIRGMYLIDNFHKERFKREGH